MTLKFEEQDEKARKTLISAKRTSVERNGLHAWHPYYAGYSEAFVSSAFRYLDCHHNTFILDPWGGSGTTGAVVSKEGAPSLCLDINPVMATFAAAKSNSVITEEESIISFFDELPYLISSVSSEPTSEPITDIFKPDTSRLITNIINAIPMPGHLDEGTDIINPRVSSAVMDTTQLINPVYAFCMSVVFVSIRELSGILTSANPTWIRTSEATVSITPEALFSTLRLNAANMLADLRAFFLRAGKVASNYCIAGDAKQIPIKRESIDRIISSPPYLTRIDYAMSTMPEMYLFGNSKLLSFVRHRTIGAPVITNNGKLQKEEWGRLCNEILYAVKRHPSKAAGSYYWKNIVQYFIDVDASLDEIVRVLKPTGSGLIVVQSSYFKDIEIPLGDIYCDMVAAKGLQSEIVYREEIKGHMAHVNTKSNVYKKGKVYFEDFVYIRKP